MSIFRCACTFGVWRYGDHSPTYYLPVSFKIQTRCPTFCHSQTIHNYFLKGLETASAFTKLDADMRRDIGLASVALVALATLALNGCGADDAGPSAASSSPAVADNGAAPGAEIPPATLVLNPASTPAVNPAAASDPIAQNMQASLAADNRQVAPVMRYAPGDSTSSN